MRTDTQTNGRTEMTKLRVTFRNFYNAPKNKDNNPEVLDPDIETQHVSRDISIRALLALLNLVHVPQPHLIVTECLVRQTATRTVHS